MKKKAAEKVEMKESLLKGEALELNDAELEGAAGGIGDAGEVLEELARQRAEKGALGAALSRDPLVGENSRQESQTPVDERFLELLESPTQKALESWAATQSSVKVCTNLDPLTFE